MLPSTLRKLPGNLRSIAAFSAAIAFLFTASAGAVMLHDGVVAAPEKALIFVMNPAGGLDAVSLDGTVRWHSNAAARHSRY